MKNQINWFDHLFNVLSVIIGVTLAFWVSDSSERQKKTEELDLIIESFIDELTTDSTVYSDYQVPNNLRQIENIETVINFLNTGEYDSLMIYFESAIGINNYSPTGSTFNSVSSTGKLDLIGDFSLKQEINKYHTVITKEAEWRGRFQVDLYTNELMPWIIYNLNLNNPDFSGIDKVALTNLLIFYSASIENKIRQYKGISEEAGYLKSKLIKFQDEQ